MAAAVSPAMAQVLELGHVGHHPGCYLGWLPEEPLWRFPEVRLHVALALDVHAPSGSPMLASGVGGESGIGHQQGHRHTGDVDLTRNPMALHAGGCVHRIAVNAELGQLGPDQSTDAGRGGAVWRMPLVSVGEGE